VHIDKTERVRWRHVAARGAVGLLAAALAACSGSSPAADTVRAATLRGPGSNPLVGSLLAASSDLGASRARHVGVLVALSGPARPAALYRWTSAHHLAVRWQHGDSYALVRGSADAMSRGFAVPIHDYRARSGKRFYATARYARVPRALRGAVTDVGSILSYTPKVTTALPPGGFHADVPAGGLMPNTLLRAYDAAPLAQSGYTGKGKTIVFFEIDGYTQADMDRYARLSGTSRFTPVLDSSMPGKVEGETEMDLEVAHAIVPDAKLVVFNAGAAWHGQSLADYMSSIAGSYKTVAQKYPGAVWSLSLGVLCDRLFSAADLQPMQDALQQAAAQGSSAFMSSGDTGGLECKGNPRDNDFGSAPSQLDVGVNTISTPPSMTVVGGTQLDTDAGGGWVSEEAWSSFALQQGTSGGPSTTFARPSWQQGPALSSVSDTTHRLTPDVAADADPVTGVKVVIDGHVVQGGGTSQAAPIWSALTVMMNQYLDAHGGKPLGDINPLLYQAARTTPSAFHDVTLGGNFPYVASKGFDYLTGLGTPDTATLVKALQAAQKAGS
jgi:kumamolisin